jgi:signal transduction histidine kinase
MDVKTILICLFVINLFMCLFTFAIKLMQRNFVGINYWILANFFIACGYLLVGLRGSIPNLFSILLAQLLFASAGLIRIVGITIFLEKTISRPSKIIAGLFLVFYISILVYFTYLHNSMYIRTLVVGIVLSGLAFYVGFLLIIHRPQKNSSAFVLTAATFWFFTFIFCFRLVIWTLFPSIRYLFKDTWVNEMQFLASLGIDILWTTLFFVINEQKITCQYIESEAKISAILRTQPDMILIQEVEGTILDYFIPKNLDTPPKIVHGDKIQTIFPTAIAEEFLVRFQRAIQNKEIQNYEYSIDSEGKNYFYEARTICLDNDKLLTIIRDITHHKEDEQKIRHQNQELLELNSTKDKIFSIIAHDLKSPFNAILGYTNLLQKNLHRYDLEKIEKQLSIIEHCASNAYNLLLNLLEWANVENGQFKFTPQKIELSSCIEKNIAYIRATAAKKNIQIKVEHELSDFVFCDIRMMDTVLRNLLSNAVKFTPADGSIKLFTVKVNDTIEINIVDSGVGIDIETQKKLFKITEKISTSGTEGEHGTGLGLILCKDFVEKNGGEISVESELGKGSIFTFTLPIYKETT